MQYSLTTRLKERGELYFTPTHPLGEKMSSARLDAIEISAVFFSMAKKANFLHEQVLD